MSAGTCSCGGQFCVHCTADPSADPFSRSVDLALAALHQAGRSTSRPAFVALRIGVSA